MLIVFFLCFENTSSCRSQEKIRNITVNSNKSNFFSSNSTWGGWNPPENNNSWEAWVNLWGTKNSSNFASTEIGQGPESGWPQYWKGLGKANDGVPPPPWAFVPLSYGKPQFCFIQPARGDCDQNLTRWGFNPSNNDCQLFEYSGCAGNENNFRDKDSCKAACVNVPSTLCETEPKINFEEMITD